jgi:ADP-ribosyl-[dinitrogen reductase] hydrolase
MLLKERIINALYGQAVADAVGNPFEFQDDIDPILVVEYANSADRLVISDDTQMTLFGFEAIQFLDHYCGDMPDIVSDSFTDSYIDWYYTQTNNPENARSFSSELGLLSLNSMYSVQSPGNTCLKSLKTLCLGDIVKNNSKGCGSVMRLLPITLLALQGYPHDEMVELAKITGAITHKHPENDKAIEGYMNIMQAIAHGLAFEPSIQANHISEIGDGWTAQECVNMAEWAYCKANSFEELLALSIAHGGDSDSVAAVAGSMWGFSGREVPKKYIAKLDALDAVTYIVSRIK